jgi:hypothetical protein
MYTPTRRGVRKAITNVKANFTCRGGSAVGICTGTARKFLAQIPGVRVKTDGRTMFRQDALTAYIQENARSSVESSDSLLTTLYDAFIRFTADELDATSVFNSCIRIGINLCPVMRRN